MANHSQRREQLDEEPPLKIASSSPEQLVAENLELRRETDTLRDLRDDLQAQFDMLKVERDDLALRLADANVAQDAEPFDPAKRYKLGAAFRSVVGPGQMVDLPRDEIIDDVYLLRLLHNAGAPLVRI